ncbi:MAG: hypothetical protein OWQ54_04555 [Sulfolobaceae archaeon]|nr:hypothetical protein [Sulfolobaceae archaeon]
MKVPKRIVLADGSEVVLSEPKEEDFCIKVNDIDKAIGILKSKSYRETRLAKNMGEMLDLVANKDHYKEIHVRVFNDGCIFSHLEISRRYVNHLSSSSIPAVLDVYEELKELNPYILYKGIRVVKVKEVEDRDIERSRFMISWSSLGAIGFLLFVLYIMKRNRH